MRASRGSENPAAHPTATLSGSPFAARHSSSNARAASAPPFYLGPRPDSSQASSSSDVLSVLMFGSRAVAAVRPGLPSIRRIAAAMDKIPFVSVGEPMKQGIFSVAERASTSEVFQGGLGIACNIFTISSTFAQVGLLTRSAPCHASRTIAPRGSSSNSTQRQSLTSSFRASATRACRLRPPFTSR